MCDYSACSGYGLEYISRQMCCIYFVLTSLAYLYDSSMIVCEYIVHF